MKTTISIKILMSILWASISFFAIKEYVRYRIEKNDSQWIDVLSLQIKQSDSIEQKSNHKIDSLEALSAMLRAENKTTKQNINLILKSNEQKKHNLLFVSDSVKIKIIDSLLRSNGYR